MAYAIIIIVKGRDEMPHEDRHPSGRACKVIGADYFAIVKPQR